MAIYKITYYSDEVQGEILNMPDSILADYLRIADLLEEIGPSIRMPHSKAMGDGLFELRTKGSEGIGRVFYCYLVGKRIVVLHSFVKKSQETPRREMNIAIKRMKEIKK
jgi:phage-related protein